MGKWLDAAKPIRAAMTRAGEFLTDEQALSSVEIYPTLKDDGSLVKAGTRINWKGQLKRAAVDLWDTEPNNPDNAISLWEDIKYTGEYREIPEIITAGLAFALGERGWWKGVLYESLMGANVFTPDQYPSGWKVVEV